MCRVTVSGSQALLTYLDLGTSWDVLLLHQIFFIDLYMITWYQSAVYLCYILPTLVLFLDRLS